MKSKKQIADSLAIRSGLSERSRTGASEGFEIGNEVRAEKLPAYLPASMRALLPVSHGLYDAMRLRSQRDVIRDVMLAASECGTWLTLAELRALTQYGEASISAQLRHLRKFEHGGYEVAKRRREDGAVAAEAATDRKEFTWEYRVGVKGYLKAPQESASIQENWPA